jgi:hypothetical protein
MKYLTLLVFVGLTACATVPNLGPVCYQLVCTE